MIISYKHNFIFIKTRKTAGSTLEHLLYPYLGEHDICTGSTRDNTPALNIAPNTNGHTSGLEISEKYPNEWRSFFKFTIERNPWDKVVSSFFWHKKIKPYLTELKNNNFTEYVRDSKLLPMDWGLYSNGKDIFKGGEVLVNKVFIYEDMKTIYSWVASQLGIAISDLDYTSIKIKSGLRPNVSYTDLHTKESIEIVNQRFKNSIMFIGYEYGNSFTKFGFSI